MGPKKQVQHEKVLLGRPGNNLKSGIVCEQRGFFFFFFFFLVFANLETFRENIISIYRISLIANNLFS